VLIVVSDGADNASKHTLSQVMVMADQSDALVYTIGVFDATDPDRNPRVLRRLAQETGGRAFFPHRLDDILPISQQIAQDIRNQYTIAYVPTNRRQDGSYRTIKVTTRWHPRGKLTVRARSGYYASTAPTRLSK
jgi:VWFA-related protein